MARMTDLWWVNVHDRFTSMTRWTSGLKTASQSRPSLRNSGGTEAGSRWTGMGCTEKEKPAGERRRVGK